MESSSSEYMYFGDFCQELLDNCDKRTETEKTSNNIIKNQLFSTDNRLANEVGQICSNMNELNLAENGYYLDYNQLAPSTSYAAAESSISATRRMSVLDDPLLKEELRKGSQHWNEQTVLHYARKLLDEEIQSLMNSIDSCQDQLVLFSIIGEFLSNDKLVINAAFDRKGSICILQKVIKKIKKTVYADILTKILATRFYYLMTHSTARSVVQKCMEVFGPGPNQVLYEQAINNFLPLATHGVGCFSLKACIDTIGGPERIILLDCIIKYSPILSTDPHGNYVVQHVLGLRISSVNHEIMASLLGHFVSISQTKEGSHVTEKLMECYDLGPLAVVKEILKTPDAAYLLARHPFGNYVIQKALVMTKNKVGFADEYKFLVDALRPHFKELRYTFGKHVIHHLKDEFVDLFKQRPAN